MEEQNRDKPGMGCPTNRPPNGTGGPDLPGVSPRGPRKPLRHPLPTKLDLRLTEDLRRALRQRALADGVTDSAMARRILLDALGYDSPLDKRSGVAVPSEELIHASKLLMNLRAVILDGRDLQDGQARGVVMAMEAQYKRLLDLINRMER